jgi:hypothetical protein
MTGSMSKPDWWPNGVDEQLVRECNCPHCQELADALDAYRDGLAPDGETATLERFA